MTNCNLLSIMIFVLPFTFWPPANDPEMPEDPETLEDERPIEIIHLFIKTDVRDKEINFNLSTYSNI